MKKSLYINDRCTCTFCFACFMHFCPCMYPMHNHRNKYFIHICLSGLNRVLVRWDWQRLTAWKMNLGPSSRKTFIWTAAYRLESQMHSTMPGSSSCPPSLRGGNPLHWTIPHSYWVTLLLATCLPIACHPQTGLKLFPFSSWNNII